MYCELDKIDMGSEEADGKLAGQTDHRSASEIETEWELSVIFALTRTINAFRTGYSGVRMLFHSPPPERFVRLVTQAGAEVGVAQQQPDGSFIVGELVPAARDDAATDLAAAEALRTLGMAVLLQSGVKVSAEGLDQLQSVYAARVAEHGGVDEDPHHYWAAVVELGAATGEILRKLYGHDWMRDPKLNGTVPWLSTSDAGFVSVFSKVERFFAQGPSEAPTHLLLAAADLGQESGTVMFNLRPADWGAREGAWYQPLLSNAGTDASGDVPLVALVRDLPNAVRNIGQDLSEAEIAPLRAEAEANIATLEVQVDTHDVGFPLVAVYGPYYASEKVFHTAFMANMQRVLGSDALMVGMPKKGALFLASVTPNPTVFAKFAAVVVGTHDDAAPRNQLSREVFLYQDGGFVDVFRPTSEH